MKKYAAVFIVLMALSIFVVHADGDPNIKVSLLSYSPYPVEPGNYVTLTFKVENTGSAQGDNVRLKFSPTYPFIVDDSSTVKFENSATPASIPSDGIISLGSLPIGEYTLVDVRVKVADNALEGISSFQLSQQSKSGDAWLVNNFNVRVQGTDQMKIGINPSTIAPGKPTDVLFILNNSGSAYVRNVVLTWSEKDNTILPLGSSNREYVDVIAPKSTAEIPFTIVANPGTTSGAYTLNANMTYIIGANITKSINVNVGIFVGGDSNFDVSVQDSQSGSISLSIANVGSNPATSVSVSIPNQPSFTISGASSSFLGNLNPGDFTLATFSGSQASRNFTGAGGGGGQGGQGRGLFNQTSSGLNVDITYTDTNGNRQTVTKQVPLRAASATTTTRGSTQLQRPDSGMNLIILGIAGIVIVILVIKYHRKIRGLIKRK
jgi:hypothetical protein